MDNPELRKSSYVDSLRISAQEHAEILDELDARQARAGDDDRRVDRRLRFSQQALLFVQIRHPGGTAGNYLVRTRNLSRTGIGFFHGGFVYTGTVCSVALRTTDRTVVTIEGRVVRCNHVRGHIHEIGVHFDKPIRLGHFLGREATAEVEDSTSTELPRLTGRVLFADDSVSDQELVKFHLQNLGVRCDIAPNAMHALDLAESVPFDLIIANLALPDMTGAALLEALRQSGYTGPAIAMTPDERDATRADALARGFKSVLVKPYQFEELLRVLLDYLIRVRTDSVEVLRSDLWRDVGMRPLIRRFIERLVPLAKEIQRAARSPQSQPILQKLCSELKGSAGGYGYPSISKAAHDLIDTSSPYDFDAKLDALTALCLAATRAPDLDRAGLPPPAAPAAPGPDNLAGAA